MSERGVKYNRYNPITARRSIFPNLAASRTSSQVPKEAWGYAGVEKTAEAALDRLRSLYEAIAKLPIAGICYTQITDVEQEINGVMTYDRKPKFDPKAVKALNDLLQ